MMLPKLCFSYIWAIEAKNMSKFMLKFDTFYENPIARGYNGVPKSVFLLYMGYKWPKNDPNL